MTTYDTTTLAAAILGDDKVEANRKTATRTLRKFLRTDFKAREVATPGKGGRYAIDLNKRELTAMTKRFAAWEVAQAEEAAARKAALEVKKAAPKVEEAADEPIIDATDADDDSSDEAQGPSDEDLAAMLEEIEDEASDEDTE